MTTHTHGGTTTRSFSYFSKGRGKEARESEQLEKSSSYVNPDPAVQHPEPLEPKNQERIKQILRDGHHEEKAEIDNLIAQQRQILATALSKDDVSKRLETLREEYKKRMDAVIDRTYNEMNIFSETLSPEQREAGKLYWKAQYSLTFQKSALELVEARMKKMMIRFCKSLEDYGKLDKEIKREYDNIGQKLK